MSKRRKANGVTCSFESGSVGSIERSDGIITVILDSYDGTVRFDSSVSRAKVVLIGACSVKGLSVKSEYPNLDALEVTSRDTNYGDGAKMDVSTIGNLSATTVMVTSAHIECGSIECDTLISRSSQIYELEWMLSVKASGYVRLFDTILECASESAAIDSPYVLLDNCYVDFKGNPAMACLDRHVEHSTIVCDTESEFACSPKVIDPITGVPKCFMYAYDPETGSVSERLERHTYEPARPANAYDRFKEATGYTNLDLHRRVDNDAVPVAPEVLPRHHTLGICSLNSFRTIETSYRSEDSENIELP